MWGFFSFLLFVCCVELGWNGASFVDVPLTGATTETMCFQCKLTNKNIRVSPDVEFSTFRHICCFLFWRRVVFSCDCWGLLLRPTLIWKIRKRKIQTPLRPPFYSYSPACWHQHAKSWQHQRGNIAPFFFISTPAVRLCCTSLLEIDHNHPQREEWFQHVASRAAAFYLWFFNFCISGMNSCRDVLFSHFLKWGGQRLEHFQAFSFHWTFKIITLLI